MGSANETSEDLEREALVELLEAEGVIADEDVADAMRRVPRRAFLNETAKPFAYAQEDVPVGEHIVALSVRTIAELLSTAHPAHGMRVLLLGTSTGYVEALLARIGCTVSTIETNERQAGYARSRLAEQNVTARFTTLDEAGEQDLVIPLKAVERLDARLLGFTPYGRTMLVIGEDKTLVALDYRGDARHPEASYSGSVWLPLFDPPLLDQEPDEPGRDTDEDGDREGLDHVERP